MKKIFGLLVAYENIDGHFILQKSLFEKISKEFDEFFIINLIHLKLIKKKSYDIKYPKNMLPDNFKIITPLNEHELNKFLIDKNLVAFTGIGKDLNSFKIQFLIKKYNIRLIYVQNISGIGNPYLEKAVSKNFINYFFILKKIIFYLLFKSLTILNLFPKIDIYFESRRAIVNNSNNSLSKKIEKIFPFLKIRYFRKIIHVNSRSFDMLTKPNLNFSEEKIVFIDSNFDNFDRIFREGKIDENLRVRYFALLNQFLLKLSKIFNKKVTICLHPQSDLKTYNKYLSTFELCKFQTNENIIQAFIIIFHESTIINDAIFLKKKIISLKSSTLGEYMMNRISYYQKLLGLFSYTLEEEKELNKDLLQGELEKITEGYDDYIKKEMMTDDSIPGEDKIINTVKEDYFINNKYF